MKNLHFDEFPFCLLWKAESFFKSFSIFQRSTRSRILSSWFLTFNKMQHHVHKSTLSKANWLWRQIFHYSWVLALQLINLHSTTSEFVRKNHWKHGVCSWSITHSPRTINRRLIPAWLFSRENRTIAENKISRAVYLFFLYFFFLSSFFVYFVLVRTPIILSKLFTFEWTFSRSHNKKLRWSYFSQKLSSRCSSF